jgi:hypothetical protein
MVGEVPARGCPASINNRRESPDNKHEDDYGREPQQRILGRIAQHRAQNSITALTRAELFIARQGRTSDNGRPRQSARFSLILWAGGMR